MCCRTLTCGADPTTTTFWLPARYYAPALARQAQGTASDVCRIGRLRRAINDSVLDPRIARQQCACSPVRPQQRDRVAGSAGHAGGHFGVGCASTTHLRRCGAGGSATANTSCDSRRGGPGVLVGEAGLACSRRHVAESVPSLASDRHHTNGRDGGRRGCTKCNMGTRSGDRRRRLWADRRCHMPC